MPRVHLPPFPYTTLFRSGPIDRCAVHTDVAVADQLPGRWNRRCEAQAEYDAVQPWLQQRKKQRARRTGLARSEEHTSELQSRENIGCRLLLAKKKWPSLM